MTPLRALFPKIRIIFLYNGFPVNNPLYMHIDSSIAYHKFQIRITVGKNKYSELARKMFWSLHQYLLDNEEWHFWKFQP